MRRFAFTKYSSELPPANDGVKNSQGVNIQTDHLDQTTRPYYYQQQKMRTSKIVDFADPADHRVK